MIKLMIKLDLQVRSELRFILSAIKKCSSSSSGEGEKVGMCLKKIFANKKNESLAYLGMIKMPRMLIVKIFFISC